ncbi:hypothetical protein D3C76_1517010 [compost metagenome]
MFGASLAPMLLRRLFSCSIPKLFKAADERPKRSERYWSRLDLLGFFEYSVITWSISLMMSFFSLSDTTRVDRREASRYCVLILLSGIRLNSSSATFFTISPSRARKNKVSTPSIRAFSIIHAANASIISPTML